MNMLARTQSFAALHCPVPLYDPIHPVLYKHVCLPVNLMLQKSKPLPMDNSNDAAIPNLKSPNLHLGYPVALKLFMVYILFKPSFHCNSICVPVGLSPKCGHHCIACKFINTCNIQAFTPQSRYSEANNLMKISFPELTTLVTYTLTTR